MSNIDDRITAALRAAANQVTENELRPDLAPTAPRRRSGNTSRWLTPLLAAAVVVGVVALGVVVANHHPHEVRVGTAVGPTSTPTQSRSISTVQPTHPSTGSSTSASTFTSYCFFSDIGCKGYETYYVPIWPFAGIAQAAAVESSTKRCVTERCPYSPSQDFNDPKKTALDFVYQYLDFADINRVTSTSVSHDQAHIGVGYLNPAGKPVTSAVLHLVKYERGIGDQYAPWEVVGTDDTTFSLESPAYGSAISNHFTAGGHITGVDENINVVVRKSDGATVAYPSILLGRCCLAAGGQHSSWSWPLTVPSYGGVKPGGAMMIVASTGGHVQEHERFAIQGVYLHS